MNELAELIRRTEHLPNSRTTSDRRATGAFYTPWPTARLLTRAALAPLFLSSPEEVMRLRIADLSCGGGVFLLAAAVEISEHLQRLGMPGTSADRAAVGCLHGWDIDESALVQVRDVFRAFAGTIPHLHHADGLSAEGSFHAILGNPPFRNAIEHVLPVDQKALLKQRFPRIGGTADHSTWFVAQADRLTLPEGSIGLVLPRPFLSAPSARRLREALDQRRPPLFLSTETAADHFHGANVRTVLLVLHASGTARGSNWGGTTSAGATATFVGEILAGMTTELAYLAKPFIIESMDYIAERRFLTARLIDPDRSRWGEVPCRYLGATYRKPVIADAATLPEILRERLRRVRRPKVMVAGVAGPRGNAEALLDSSGEFVGAVSTWLIFHPHDDIALLRMWCDRLNEDATAHAVAEQLSASAMGGGLLTIPRRFLAERLADSEVGVSRTPRGEEVQSRGGCPGE